MTINRNALADFGLLCRFIGRPQWAAIRSGLAGEESSCFGAKLRDLAETIRTMPKTYEQDGTGQDAVAFLHYFAGGSGNWWITEKDAGDDADDPDAEQHQAFGLADLGYGGELGYISIAELIKAGVELDFHFTPTTIRDLMKGRAAA